jgi:thiamine-monophosphate kinase
MTDRLAAGEFEIIARYFRPLSEGEPGALDLADDAAVLEWAAGQSLVVTTDVLIAGVHFFPGDRADLVARKLLRVNLSDLAAMGAKPRAYLLSCALPADVSEGWLTAFREGLAEDQRAFGVVLVGGDTVATPGPVTLCATALGEVPRGAALRRNGARRGDIVFVSGTIGDGALGLKVLCGEARDLEEESRAALVARYHLPSPRLDLGLGLRGIAHAAIDVSDGLVGDLAHICEVSGVAAVVDWARVPLSAAARGFLTAVPEAREAVLAGGDDYELLFTAAPESREEVATRAARAGVPVTEIGFVTEGDGVLVRDATGSPIALERGGYSHFAARAP